MVTPLSWEDDFNTYYLSSVPSSAEDSA